MAVLNLFVSPRKAENVVAYIEKTLGKKSRSLWFGARPILGSFEQTPLPLMTCGTGRATSPSPSCPP